MGCFYLLQNLLSSCQLPTEFLNKIFEYFKDDKTTLYLCLLTGFIVRLIAEVIEISYNFI